MNWLENVDILFECNDLISMDIDAIVGPVNVNLEKYGRISKKLFNLGGSHLNSDIISARNKLSNGSLALGEAISLNCKSLYNIAVYSMCSYSFPIILSQFYHSDNGLMILWSKQII